jgi:hypothetical protein
MILERAKPRSHLECKVLINMGFGALQMRIEDENGLDNECILKKSVLLCHDFVD